MGAAGAGAALFAGSSLLQAGQRTSASKIAAKETETQARFEELGATQREVDRKARLADALASQNAMAGAKGISAFEGSPLTILNADIAAEEEATERDLFQTKLRTEAMRSGSKIRQRQQRTSTALGLLGDTGQLAIQSKNFAG